MYNWKRKGEGKKYDRHNVGVNIGLLRYDTLSHLHCQRPLFDDEGEAGNQNEEVEVEVEVEVEKELVQLGLWLLDTGRLDLVRSNNVFIDCRYCRQKIFVHVDIFILVFIAIFYIHNFIYSLLFILILLLFYFLIFRW
jgi:hypothetical protein